MATFRSENLLTINLLLHIYALMPICKVLSPQSVGAWFYVVCCIGILKRIYQIEIGNIPQNNNNSYC